jgi:hypothetical protein
MKLTLRLQPAGAILAQQTRAKTCEAVEELFA